MGGPADNLRYLQLCTEDLSLTKYLTKSEPGKKTYALLSFSELERAQPVNSIDSFAAALHERFSRAMSVEQANPDAQELLAFLSDLKPSIYRRPYAPSATPTSRTLLPPGVVLA